MKFRERNSREMDIVKRVCENRGVDFERLDEFINPSKENVENPLKYTNMLTGAELILEAVNSGAKIGILVDSDCDGYCSAAMLINYIRETFSYNNFSVYFHTNKTHGLTEEIIGKILIDRPSLVITPDSSSMDFKSHKELFDNNIKVLVLDHHDCEGYSDHAVIVNPRLVNDGNKTLSGGGVVLKMLELLDHLTNNQNANNYYDLASVSLVADCMDMTQLETRYYVQTGMRNINNPLIEELCRADLSKKNYEAISYDIAPVVNAFIRVGTEEEKHDLFWAMIGCNYEREISIRGQGTLMLAVNEYVARLSNRIKSRQNTQVTKALDDDNTKIITRDDIPVTFCILCNGANRNLTGLIGNRLVSKYNKPAVVVVNEPKSNTLVGSGRTTETFDNFKTYLSELGVFKKCAGHEGAFGVVLEMDKVDHLLEKLSQRGADIDLETHLVDKAYIGKVSAYDILAVAELEDFYSKGFEKPLFYIEVDVDPKNVKIVGPKQDTIRIQHDSITYVKFKCDADEVNRIRETNINKIRVLGSFSTNEWNDRIYPQVVIDELEIEGDKSECRFKNESPFGFKNVNWT